MKEKSFRGLVYFGLIAACLLLYGGTLSYPFVFDDHIYLLENPLVVDAHSFSFPAHFTQFANSPAKLGVDPDLSVNFILRPFSYLTYYLNYAASGWKPNGFRAVNIVLHLLNSLLVFEVLWLLARRAGAERDSWTTSARFI